MCDGATSIESPRKRKGEKSALTRMQIETIYQMWW